MAHEPRRADGRDAPRSVKSQRGHAMRTFERPLYGPFTTNNDENGRRGYVRKCKNAETHNVSPSGPRAVFNKGPFL